MEQQQQDYLGMDTIVAALSGLSAPEFEEVCGRANAARAAILAEQQNAPMSDIDGADDDGAAAPAPDGSEMDDEQASPPPVVAPPAPGTHEIVAMSDDNPDASGDEAEERRSFALKLARVDQRFKIVVRDHNGKVYGADLETTEAQDAVAEPVEIYVYNINTGKTCHKYVLPNRAITPDAYEKHELDLEKLRAYGAEPLADVLASLLNWIEEDSGGDGIIIIEHSMFDVKVLVACLQREGLPTNLFVNATIIDTLDIARRQLKRHDLDEAGLSLGALHLQLRRCEFADAHSAGPDARAAVRLAACLLDASGCETFAAFLDNYGCRPVVKEIEFAVEDTTASGGALSVRMGPEGAAAVQAAWDAGQGLTIAEGLALCFDNGAQSPYWESAYRQRMLADTAAAQLSGEMRLIGDYEGSRPTRDAPAFASRYCRFPVPERCDDPDERARLWEAAFADFRRRYGWDLRATEYWGLDWRNLEHCAFREEWFRKWNSLADGDGMRPWTLGADFSWEKMVEVMEVHVGRDFAAWLRNFNDRCERAAAASRAKPDACEHCAQKRLAALAARRSHTRRAAPSLFRSGSVRVVLPHVPLRRAAGAAELVPDHVKGTPCLRAWACPPCNIQETPTYDISSDVRAALHGAADASCLRADTIGTTPG